MWQVFFTFVNEREFKEKSSYHDHCDGTQPGDHKISSTLPFILYTNHLTCILFLGDFPQRLCSQEIGIGCQKLSF